VFLDEQGDHVILAFTEGNKEAFKSLYLKYKDKVFGTLLKYVKDKETALDLMQEAFIRIDKYKNSIDTETSFRKLLFAIAINGAIDYLRKKKRYYFQSLDEQKNELSPQFEDSRSDFTRTLEAEDMHTDVQRALDTLPENERTAVILRTMSQMTYKDAALTMDVSSRTVQRYVKNGLEKLEEFLINIGYSSRQGIVHE